MSKKKTTSKAKAKAKAKEDQPKLSVGELRELHEVQTKKIEKLEGTAKCPMCGQQKPWRENFYLDTDPMLGGHTFTRICRECAKGIACRKDANGELHEPTRESVQLALKYLNKPFYESVWSASINEAKNTVSLSPKENVWASYIKNIQMKQYVGDTYFSSDFFKEKIVYEDEMTEKELIESHSGMDTYDSFLKNKADVIRLLDYDPFEKELPCDQPFLYSQLLGLIDSGGDGNDDMLRTSACISIVRNIMQAQKIDDTISSLMIDVNQLEQNSAIIRTLQDSKQKIIASYLKLAEDNCISLKHSRNAVKGENTWTGKIKKIKDLNLREGQVNGFDIGTCRGMQQVLDLSNASIMKQLALDESEWSDMVAEQRKIITSIQLQLSSYKEVNRILLRENLDLKDFIEEKGIDINKSLVNLKEVYSPFSDVETEQIDNIDESFEEVEADESDNTSE